MGVPTSEVSYIPAMPRREDHEVHRGRGGIGKKKKSLFNNTDSSRDCIVLNESVIINNKLERVWKEQLLLVWVT